MDQTILRIHPHDNVAVALVDIEAGQDLCDGTATVTALRKTPVGHKIAMEHILRGGIVVKYGFAIGTARKDIAAGDWVHSENLSSALTAEGSYTFEPKPPSGEREVPSQLQFQGFLRPGGEVGIRNEIWIINTVGCVNKTAERIAQAAHAIRPEGIDGVYSFSHPFGCSQLEGDLAKTQSILAGLVKHPNAAGVLVLGLGCENNHIGLFREVLGSVDGDRVVFLNAQDAGNETAEGLKLVVRLMNRANLARRTPQPLARLKVGLKCGGSDAFSGITANPLVGRFSDRLAAMGGAVVMTEVPEMFGAETSLLARCASSAVYDSAVAMIDGFKQYYARHNMPVYDNPSPGNKDGGITTLEEKSLGCVQKGGSATIVDVLMYGQRLSQPGLALMDGPGNDMVACTALAAAGAQLILFTTGRGTPLGGPVPTIKIASNSLLAKRKSHWIDFDAGRLLGRVDFPTLTDELLDIVTMVAGGRRLTLNEINGYREIGIWKDGVYL